MAGLRSPRAFVEIGGARIPVIAASVNRSAQRNSDTFDALISISTAMRVDPSFDLNFWADWDPQDVSIIMSTTADGGDERTMVTGKVDVPNIALASYRVALSGRDKGASLGQKKRNEKFNNQKPKDIAGKIAQDHGLDLQFTGDGDFAGKIYTQDTVSLALNKTDFELLSGLAEQIGYRWFVDGSTLYFEPKDSASDSYDVVWKPPAPSDPAFSNVLDLSVHRNMDAARPHTYRVKSWHSRSKKLFKSEARVDGVGDPLVYEDHHPGKTQAQVEQLAKSRMKDRIRHELQVTVRDIANLACDVRQTLNLSGTGTIYDQSYTIDKVSFSYTIEGEGEFAMTVSANSAKSGRDPDGDAGGSGNGASNGNAASNAPTSQTVPLPPARPPGLGGSPAGTGATTSV